ncbi:hypothetical protein [Parendozoicomonas sp. Alg238-R29]|uniref:hypothetical protein n=1 Tax=Parendozoicomonas sp. Alg238-R29 TaxID=2993446 RepID=UPI00248D8D0F|nr:hypothetical protein [Parendozoicomonas sp. Alg238-R29]
MMRFSLKIITAIVLIFASLESLLAAESAEPKSEVKRQVLILVEPGLHPYLDSFLLDEWVDRIADEGWNVNLRVPESQSIENLVALKEYLYQHADVSGAGGVILVGAFPWLAHESFDNAIHDLWLTTRIKAVGLKLDKETGKLQPKIEPYYQHKNTDFWLSRITPPEKNEADGFNAEGYSVEEYSEWVNRYLNDNIASRQKGVALEELHGDCTLEGQLVCTPWRFESKENVAGSPAGVALRTGYGLHLDSINVSNYDFLYGWVGRTVGSFWEAGSGTIKSKIGQIYSAFVSMNNIIPSFLMGKPSPDGYSFGTVAAPLEITGGVVFWLTRDWATKKLSVWSLISLSIGIMLADFHKSYDRQEKFSHKPYLPVLMGDGTVQLKVSSEQ